METGSSQESTEGCGRRKVSKPALTVCGRRHLPTHVTWRGQPSAGNLGSVSHAPKEKPYPQTQEPGSSPRPHKGNVSIGPPPGASHTSPRAVDEAELLQKFLQELTSLSEWAGQRLCLWPIAVPGSGASSSCARYRTSLVAPCLPFTSANRICWGRAGRELYHFWPIEFPQGWDWGAESGVRASNWLGEIILSASEEVGQDGEARPGCSRASGSSQTVEVRGAEKRHPRAMAAVAAAAALRARILQASEGGAKGLRNSKFVLSVRSLS